jgi:DNA-binding NarL/FixJ family response regulator
MITRALPRARRARLTPASVVRKLARAASLSERETAVVQRAAEGLNRKETAHKLGCSLWTVELEWRRILRKTGQRSEPELLALLLALAIDMAGK